MCNNGNLVHFNSGEVHKGFYNNGNPTFALSNIPYSDFFEEPDGDFPYSSARDLLCGSCDSFALSLYKLLNYSPYVIRETTGKGFHAFCQIYKNKKWYFVDARGMTTSFSEFVGDIRLFVDSEFIIQPVSNNDIMEWKLHNEYSNEGLKFAEAFIKKYSDITCCKYAAK